MIRSIDFKALGLGVATVAGGYLALAVPATIAANLSDPTLSPALFALAKLGVLVVPAVAGYVAAYRARSRRIIHGTVGGLLGVTLLVCAVAYLLPSYPSRDIPQVIVASAVLASLGAIFGKRQRDKLGP